MAATGGSDPEPVRDVKLYAPQAFRKNERAVSEADYAAWAEQYPDVPRAVAVRRWTGSWYTMLVVVDRLGGRLLDAEFRAGLRAHLARYRLAGFDLELADPIHVSLDVNLVVCVRPGFFRSDVRKSLLDAFTAGQRTDGRHGFFHPDRFSFGQPVHLGNVVAAAMAVPGVEWVDTRDPRVRFQRFGRAAAGELAGQVIAMGPMEIARLDNSPSLPENGRLGVDLDGGR
jgi:predicted phage baseplate assembly protein